MHSALLNAPAATTRCSHGVFQLSLDLHLRAHHRSGSGFSLNMYNFGLDNSKSCPNGFVFVVFRDTRRGNIQTATNARVTLQSAMPRKRLFSVVAVFSIFTELSTPHKLSRGLFRPCISSFSAFCLYRCSVKWEGVEASGLGVS